MDQLTEGNFVAGELYNFNLVIKGQLVSIEATFTGNGETVGDEQVGHFVNPKSNHTFKWTKKAAIAHLPVLWAEKIEAF